MHEQIIKLKESIGKVIVGKDDVIRCVTAGMLTGGHILIEDVPGVGKTQLAAALSRSIGGTFNRIQLTPDVMPSDITGFSMVNQTTFELEYRPGAAMCNFLLADEINRASPKVQSALLEVMEEHQISIDGETHRLPQPFMVLATQNPVETYGTYHLPEAQMDRFFMRVSMGYPTEDEEMQILSRTERHNPLDNITEAALHPEDIVALQKLVEEVHVSDAVKRYILQIVAATRKHDALTLGASPRGSIALYKAAKANAFLSGRDFVLPDDVKQMAESVLAHRLILSPKGKAQHGDARTIIRDVLSKVSVPMESGAVR
ncbi:MAG: MoxR family ATPase [Oscillospiraceae bacterium]|nr:MoxR family ATPase [Oscillospiraceae bacterium]